MDFASDKMETKRVARAMMKMSDEINNTLLPATGRESTLQVRCVTCHRGVARPQQLDDLLAATVESDGVDAAVQQYRTLRAEHYGSAAYDFSAATLNSLAETLARESDDTKAAVKVLELNLEHNPDSAYAHLMLGQVQMQNGDKEAAIASIERALELEPDNDYAKRMLQRVKAAE
jgi:lipopolysaccharide biosynthesis regulator YciM